MPLLFGDIFMLFLEFLLFCTSGFMILLVLVQRGRGGGLTGALGGMGGQSAFGAKAGDVFTKITVGSAVVWICLCLVTIRGYTYVNVNTTAMKEYQYTKLMKDTTIGGSNVSDPLSGLNLGGNPDDGPGASLSSLDSEEDKKDAEKDQKGSEDKTGENGKAGVDPDDSDTKKTDDSSDAKTADEEKKK